MNCTAQKQSRTLLYYVHPLLTRAGSATQDKAGKDLTARCAGTPNEEVGKVHQTPTMALGGLSAKLPELLPPFFNYIKKKKSPAPSPHSTGAFYHFFGKVQSDGFPPATVPFPI